MSNVDFEEASPTGPYAEADDPRLKQALDNVIEAAKSSTPDQGVVSQDDPGLASLKKAVRRSALPPSGGLLGFMVESGLTDEEIIPILQRKQTELRLRGVPEEDITYILTGNLSPPKKLPQAYIDRFLTGEAFTRTFKMLGKGAAEGFGSAPLGINPTGETDQFLRDIGLFNKPGEVTFLRTLNESLIRPVAAFGDAVQRAISAGISAVGYGTAEAVSELNPYSRVGTTEGERDVEKGGEEISTFLDIAGLLSLTSPVMKPSRTLDGKLVDTKVGGIPTAQDFGNAARSIAGNGVTESVQQKLIRIWTERGVHPSEVAADASQDVTITQKLLSSSDELPYEGSSGIGRTATGVDQSLVGGNKPPPKEGEILGPEPTSVAIEHKPTINVVTDEATTKAFDTILGKIDFTVPYDKAITFDELWEKTIDELWRLEKTEKELSGTGKLIESELDSPTKLARLLAGSADKARSILDQGPINFFTYERVGEGLKQILAPVRNLTGWGNQKVSPLRNLSAFLTSMRVVELEHRGIKSGFDIDAAINVVNSAPPQVKVAAMKLIQFQNSVAAYLRDAGIISHESFDAMTNANKMFVPFWRVIENDRANRGGRAWQPYDPIKAISGSERTIVDPLEAIIKNTFLLTELADRNTVGVKLIDKMLEMEAALPMNLRKLVKIENDESGFDTTLKAIGSDKIDEELFAKAVPKETTGHYSIYRDGKKETYLIDPDLARILKGMDGDTANLLIKILHVPASIKRAAIVLDPRFWTYYLARDFSYAIGTFPGFTPLDTVKGLLSHIMRDKNFHEWSIGGGGNSSMMIFDRRYLQEALEDLTEKTGLTTRAWNVIVDPESTFWQKLKAGAGWATGMSAVNRYLIHPARLATTMVLEANKLGAFKKAMRGKDPTKENILRAAYLSRETGIDPARIGSNMRSFNMISVFLNAAIAEPIRMARLAKENPVFFTIAASTIALPSIIEWWLNKDDSRYKEIPDWQKDLFYIIITDKWEPAKSPSESLYRPSDQVKYIDGKLYVNNGTIYRLPNPFAMGVIFGGLTKRILQAWYDADPSAVLNSSFFDSVWQSSIPSAIPTAITPAYEQFANRSEFTGNTIVPAYAEKYLPEYQYTPYTNEVTRVIGGLLSAFPGMREFSLNNNAPLSGVARALTTPALLDNYINAWTGGIGNYILALANEALIKSGMAAKLLNETEVAKPASTLADIPFVKAFVIRYPSATSKSIQTFMDDYEHNAAYFNTWKMLLERGQIDAAQGVIEAGGYQNLVKLDGIYETITGQLAFIRMVNFNPRWSSDEKRQLIDMAYYTTIKLAQEGNKVLSKVKQQFHKEKLQ